MWQKGETMKTLDLELIEHALCFLAANVDEDNEEALNDNYENIVERIQTQLKLLDLGDPQDRGEA